MSDLKNLDHVDDLFLKNNQPNHLASQLEKQAAAGMKLPAHLVNHLEHLQSCTALVQQALKPLLPQEMLQDCTVAHADRHRLTVALSSSTAANHLRYLTANFVQALRAYDEQFCYLDEFRVIVTPKPIQSDSRQTSSKKTLSENTKRIITQTASTVIHDDQLKQALLRLTKDN